LFAGMSRRKGRVRERFWIVVVVKVNGKWPGFG
jgi:hypothetical protein